MALIDYCLSDGMFRRNTLRHMDEMSEDDRPWPEAPWVVIYPRHRFLESHGAVAVPFRTREEAVEFARNHPTYDA